MSSVEMLLPKLQQYLEQCNNRLESLPAERKRVLEKISVFIIDRVRSHKRADLLFICTHNSRRSMFGQIWAQTCAEYYGLRLIKTYSGGTTATAFYPSAIKAAADAGFVIKKIKESDNPFYEVYFSEDDDPMLTFSKTIDDAANPMQNFCAIITCNEADKACPSVSGASVRINCSYDDPKVSDGSPSEEIAYSERCAQIATEFLYVMKKVHQSVTTAKV